MPQLIRHYCSNCQKSVYDCVIAGVRVPLLFYLVVGQPDDTGAPLDVNGPGVQVPAFVRELMQLPSKRIELCIACLADLFGQALVTADADGMYDAEMQTAREQSAQQPFDPSRPRVEVIAEMQARALAAIKVGRGAMTAAQARANVDPKPATGGA